MATDSGSSVFDSLVEDHTALMQTLSKKLTVLSSKGDGAFYSISLRLRG